MSEQRDRRHDCQLREAINRVRDHVSSADGCCTIYQHTLDELCVISQSAIGMVVGLRRSDNHGPKFELLCLSGTNEKQSALLTNPDLVAKLQHLEKQLCFVEQVFTDCQSVVYSDGELSHIDPKAQLWPTFKQALAVPLIDHHTVVAVMLLFNADKNYHSEVAKRCRPLLTTAVCLRRVVQNCESFNNTDPANTEQDLDWCDLFHAVERYSPLGMVVIDKEFKITRFNPEAEKVFSIPGNDALGRTIDEFIPERFAHQHRIKTFTQMPSVAGRSTRMTLIGRRTDGKDIPLYVNILPFTDQDEINYLLTITDDTEISAIKAEQEAQTQRFKAVSDLAPIGILQTNMQWEAQYANDRWCDICGLSKEEVLGMGWINGLYHEDVSHTLETLRNAVIEGLEFDGECRFQTPLGDIVWVELHARPLFTPKGEINGFIATLTDCTYRHITEHKLRLMAERDSLTGLANRALFQDRLQQCLKRVDRHGSLALLCLDLDGFKNINDTLGHDSGDLLLTEVAERLVSCVRDEDTVARVGGDEFMILMEGLKNANIAAEISEKILSKLETPFNLGKQEVFISTSIGISFAVGQQGVEGKTLMKQADMALYRAKAEGRNNFQFYAPELEGASKDRLYLGNCLHRALDRSEFQVFYQLQAEVDGQRIAGSEALLRWNHPERGLLPPKEFISLLEETGLINPVSRWLWYQAFADHKRWIDQGLLDKDCTISINLSPRQLRDPQLAHSFEAAMVSADLPGSSVVAEITESALIEESSHTGEILQSLRSLGVHIALDDFGTGFSSLTYLKRFAIDTIKIDQTFIRDLLTDPEDAAITQAVLALARSLNISVVSEGVENHETLALLEQWGCDYFQGYYLNKPSSAEDITALLESSSMPHLLPKSMKLSDQQDIHIVNSAR